MALTKVTGQVIKNTTDVTVGVLTVTNTLAVGGTVSIGGTLTYEDVTNIDSVGLITARNGIVVGSGITLSKDGDIFATGVTTSTTFVGNLTGNVTVSANNSTDETVYPVFVDGTGSKALETDTSLNYNPSSNNLTAGTFIGAVSGTTGTFSGDVAASKITNTGGDTDTFINFPSADTFKVRQNGNDTFHINSSGKVSINTTDTTGARDLLVTAQSNSDTGISFRGGASSQQYIAFGDGTSGGAQNIGQIEYNHALNSMRFDTNGSERVRITNIGRVGIGIQTQN